MGTHVRNSPRIAILLMAVLNGARKLDLNCPHQRTDALKSLAAAIIGEPVDNLHRGARVVKIGSADLHGARSGNDEFERILYGRNAPNAEEWDLDRTGRLKDTAHGNGLDR